MAILAADRDRRTARDSANCAIKVAGGHTIRSTAASDRDPAMIFSSSTAERSRPFIFQSPAISGRRVVIVGSIFSGSIGVRHQGVSRPLASRKVAIYKQIPSVAGPRCDPYDARLPSGRCGRHHTSTLERMLRGIRNASANWLGRTVMTVVMGLLAASFAVWGINDIFRGFGRSTLAKVGGTEISIEAFRQAYNDRLQQLGRAGRPADHGRASQGDRPRSAGAERDGGRSRARSAGAPDAARHTRRRNRQAHHRRQDVPKSGRPVRPHPVRAAVAQRRLHRAALRRRAAAGDAAPGHRQLAVRRYSDAKGVARRHQYVPEPGAYDRLCRRSVRPRPAIFRSRATRT